MGNFERTAYDFESVDTVQRYAPMYEDCYYAAGWEKVELDTQYSPSPQSSTTPISLRFRRSRKIENRTELQRLQTQCIACIKRIIDLERSRGGKPVIASLITAAGAYSATALAVAAVISFPVTFPVVIGMGGTAASTLACIKVHKKVQRGQENKTLPLLDKEYEDFNHYCTQMQSLCQSAI